MEKFTAILEKIDGAVWGIPLIVLILAGGILLTLRLRGLQVRHLGKAFRYMVKNEEEGEGEVTSFGACVQLSAQPSEREISSASLPLYVPADREHCSG